MAGGSGGDIQSHNRACLQGLIFIAQYTYGDAVMYPDATYLLDGVKNGQLHNPVGLNADAWCEAGKRISNRCGKLSFQKANAHRASGRHNR